MRENRKVDKMKSLYSDAQIKNHLERYKRERLKINENGIWKNNKKEYPHILPSCKRSKNLIEKEYINSLLSYSLNSKKALHSGFHHLNSSQALAINLFVPFLVEKNLVKLLQDINIRDSIEKCKFEYIENEEEGTNFDFFVKGKINHYYFEVKYSEQKFGYAKNDNRHKDKFNNLYSPKLKSIYPIGWDEFRKDYQLWRNISYIDKGHVFFVFPKFRNDLTDIVNEAKEKINQKDRVHILYIDQIVDCFERIIVEKKEHYSEFREKYLAIDGI